MDWSGIGHHSTTSLRAKLGPLPDVLLPQALSASFFTVVLSDFSKKEKREVELSTLCNTSPNYPTKTFSLSLFPTLNPTSYHD